MITTSPESANRPSIQLSKTFRDSIYPQLKKIDSLVPIPQENAGHFAQMDSQLTTDPSPFLGAVSFVFSIV